jgi:serine/threonine protein kinase
VEGVSLERVLRSEGRLPLFRTLVIASQVARALGAAHERSVIHHDLKPDNILLQRRAGRRDIVREAGSGSLIEPEGPFDFVTILDFGAAKYLDQAMAGAGVVIGTPAYMAPETAQDGIADQRSDIYGLGVVIYEMLTGTVPFEGNDPTEIMIKQVRVPVPAPRLRCPEAEITPEAERTIARALAKRPQDRYQNMAELHGDLERCYGSLRSEGGRHAGSEETTSSADLRQPIPLTQVKPGVESDPDLTPDLLDSPTQTTFPIGYKKSGRHKTLPFGVPVIFEGRDELKPPPSRRG